MPRQPWLAPQLEVARHDGIVLPDLGEPASRTRVIVTETVLAQRRVGDLPHERVLERKLARPPEPGTRLLDEDLGCGEVAQHFGRVRHTNRVEPCIPADLPEDR